MNTAAKKIQKTYLTLTLLSTLATSFIWGLNTLFLLDAGLNNLQAFAANAFFTVGQVLFEIPTGVVADTWGRRTSYLLGCFTLLASTVMYLFLWQVQAPFIWWALSSMLLGLGFTFFSGATEAWLVDALHSVKFTGDLDSVFGRGQAAGGIAMLAGTVLGGAVAQFTNLGVPYIMRIVILGLTLGVAYVYMHDMGFKPVANAHPLKHTARIFRLSVDHGWRKPPVKWMMLTAPATFGVGIYAFYALQPYLLELYGDKQAYLIAGLAAAIFAGAQIAGGLLVGKIRGLFKRRTTIIILGTILGSIMMALMALVPNFWFVLAVIVIWGMVWAAMGPLRQAYLNGLIPSAQRATVLSFDSLMGSSGGIVAQPALGRVADIYGYGSSYLVGAGLQLLALPFALAARRSNASSDKIASTKTT